MQHGHERHTPTVRRRGGPLDKDLFVVKSKAIADKPAPSRRRAARASAATEGQIPTFSKQAIDQFPALVWRAGVDAKCDYFNRAWLNFTGRTLQQEQGDGWAEGVHPDDIANCLRNYLRAFKARKPFVIEYRLRRYDGQYRWILDQGRAFHGPDGRFAGYIGSCVDATELRNAEERVRFQASLLDQVRNAVIATDPDGKIIYWNRFAEKLYQWTAAEVTGRSILNVTVPAVRREEAMAIITTLANEGHWFGEFEVRRKDGRRFMAEVHNARIEDARGMAIGLVGVSADITARKRVEKRLHDSKEQLRALMARVQHVREEEGARIAREIHDELGQTLTSLALDLNWMNEQVTAGARTRRDARLCLRLKDMNARLETTARAVQRIATELRPQMLDDLGLAATIEWQAEEFAMRTGISCRWIQRPNVAVPDRAQATALFRIFQEVLTNIIRHARAQSVTLQMRQVKADVILEVTDNGIGFKPARLLDRASLGLLGMRERAARVGGRVEIRSAPGKGTRVTVITPAKSGARQKNSAKDGHGKAK
jgi:PAS domain S-box-containing protein